MVGDIYLGRVANVKPGIRAAFVDIGHKQDAFLHFSDIGSAFSEYSSLIGDEDGDVDTDDDGDDEEETSSNHGSASNHGDSSNQGNSSNPEQSPQTAVAPPPSRPQHHGGRDGRDRRDGRNGRDGREGRDGGREGRDGGREGRDGGREGRDGGREGRDGRDGGRDGRDGRDNGRRQPAIPDLKKGQDIIVQVTKEPVAKKGVRVTSEVSLPGRFLVLLPFDGKIGISKKMSNFKEKRRLRRIM